MTEEILQVEDLRVSYETVAGSFRAVDGVSFVLNKGERLGLVGESGSGKSTAALSMLRLLKPPAKVETGKVMLDGVDLLSISEDAVNNIRFAQMSLIPQGAMNSLNPVLRIKNQLEDVIRTHDKSLAGAQIEAHIGELLEMVGLQKEVARRYPHELSGGMKQRVCIAMAISLQPKVIIADEPTSALDVVTQRQVMETLERVQQVLNASVVLVGHDMGIMAQFVDTIGVMYAGKLVEIGPVSDLFREPLHPYSQLLISSLPSLEARGVFKGIPGIAPSLRRPPPGCKFHPRCPQAMEHCSVESPVLTEVRPKRWVSCHLY